MALMAPGAKPREDIVATRFKIAQDGKPSEEQLTVQRDLRVDFAELADEINHRVEDGREKSLALTALEEALMWAGKAIFK